MVDRTTVATGAEAAVAEIAVLRQKLAAAVARIEVKMGRHKATEAYKDNAFKRLTSWTSAKVETTPTPDNRHERMATLLRDMNNPRVCEPQLRIAAGAPSRIRPAAGILRW